MLLSHQKDGNDKLVDIKHGLTGFEYLDLFIALVSKCETFPQNLVAHRVISSLKAPLVNQEPILFQDLLRAGDDRLNELERNAAFLKFFLSMEGQDELYDGNFSTFQAVCAPFLPALVKRKP